MGPEVQAPLETVFSVRFTAEGGERVEEGEELGMRVRSIWKHVWLECRLLVPASWLTSQGDHLTPLYLGSLLCKMGEWQYLPLRGHMTIG